MDAISSLIGGSQRAQAAFDAAAQQIAVADLLTAANPAPAATVAPGAPAAGGGDRGVDVGEQLITMGVAADMHHVTTAALRAAFSLYHDSLDLIRPDA